MRDYGRSLLASWQLTLQTAVWFEDSMAIVAKYGYQTFFIKLPSRTILNSPRSPVSCCLGFPAPVGEGHLQAMLGPRRRHGISETWFHWRVQSSRSGGEFIDRLSCHFLRKAALGTPLLPLQANNTRSVQVPNTAKPLKIGFIHWKFQEAETRKKRNRNGFIKDRRLLSLQAPFNSCLSALCLRLRCPEYLTGSVNWPSRSTREMPSL
ncbi:hypothetical protein VTN49DRAFT_2133 [Thermomyces lanuginosus]|uniref:uncharacterized protein n=1 Tax=Thermomyces lanuginosus TaxID=5541 RepID=UPI003743047F